MKMARNQSFQQAPRKRVQRVQYQPHAVRPGVIFDNYLNVYKSYRDMVQPTPVVRPTVIYINEFEDLTPHRETEYVDRRGVPRGHPVATFYSYADDVMRIPEQSRIKRKQPMPSRIDQTRPGQQTRPWTRQQQQARPQQYQQKVLVNNLKSTVSEKDMKEIFDTIGRVITSRLIRPGIAEAVFLKKLAEHSLAFL